jgi:hypothetical protein
VGHETEAPPMTLGNMRELGVPGLMVYCLNPKCLNRDRLDVDGYGMKYEYRGSAPAGFCTSCGMIGARRPTKLGRAAADRKPYRQPVAG